MTPLEIARILVRFWVAHVPIYEAQLYHSGLALYDSSSWSAAVFSVAFPTLPVIITPNIILQFPLVVDELYPSADIGNENGSLNLTKHTEITDEEPQQAATSILLSVITTILSAYLHTIHLFKSFVLAMITSGSWIFLLLVAHFWRETVRAHQNRLPEPQTAMTATTATASSHEIFKNENEQLESTHERARNDSSKLEHQANELKATYNHIEDLEKALKSCYSQLEAAQKQESQFVTARKQITILKNRTSS